jgi:hypothetical protein
MVFNFVRTLFLHTDSQIHVEIGEQDDSFLPQPDVVQDGIRSGRHQHPLHQHILY